jgi:hypothetical protein
MDVLLMGFRNGFSEELRMQSFREKSSSNTRGGATENGMDLAVFKKQMKGQDSQSSPMEVELLRDLRREGEADILPWQYEVKCKGKPGGL